MSVYTSGWLVIPYGHLNSNETQERLRDLLAKKIPEELGIDLPEDYQVRYPGIRISDWATKVDALINVLCSSLKDCETQNL